MLFPVNPGISPFGMQRGGHIIYVVDRVNTGDTVTLYGFNPSDKRQYQTSIGGAYETDEAKLYPTETFILSEEAGTPELIWTGATFGSELNTDANATSITNEADATTGWTQTNLTGTGANVFQSQSSVKSDGSYAFEANANDTPTNSAKFYKDLDADFGITSGKFYKIDADVRHVGTGGTWAYRLSEYNALNINFLINNSIVITDTTFETNSHYILYDGIKKYLGAREVSGTEDGGIYFDKLSVKEVITWNNPMKA